MVGTLLLMKMLHCKSIVEDSNGISSTNANNSRTTRLKREVNRTEPCRVCQKEANMNIKTNSSSEAKCRVLKRLCNIDDTAIFLCESCNTLLEGAMLLRKTALYFAKKSETTPAEDDCDTTDFIDHDTNYENKKPLTKVKTHRCVQCNISFNTFQEYDEHRFSDEHENMRRTCPICHKAYKAVYFKKHLQSHEPGRAYVCDICGKNIYNQGHFTKHRLTHFYQLPFKCSLCPYRGRFSESLKMHMRSHTGEKPYQCAECPSRFVSKSNLNKHALTHKGDHDFKCEVCSRGFYTKRELDLHDKVEHRGIKEHICSICGKAFGYRKQMMKHQLKVHKREKLRSGRMPIYLQVETLNKEGQNVAVET